MKDHQDAYGYLVYDYLQGEDATEIVERDDGFIAVSGGPAVHFAPYKDWPSHQKRAMRFVRGRVLDAGCGAGRHPLHLQEKGLDVVGIDLSPLAVEVSKARGDRDARVMPITQVSSKELGKFDPILMMGTNFGLFGDFSKARRLLKRFDRIANARARIIGETRDPNDTTEQMHLEYHDLNRKKG